MIGGRVPKLGPDTYEILSVNAIKIYLNYLDQLKHLFTRFIHRNLNTGKKVNPTQKLFRNANLCYRRLDGRKLNGTMSP